MSDFAARRVTMVDTQVRPQDVTKFPIIATMLKVAREEFVPELEKETAYADRHINLGKGRVLLDPRTFAKILDALAIENDDLVLDLGAGYGYSAAVIAGMAEAVVAVESDADMSSESADMLARSGSDNVILHQGVLAAGAAEHGPYDVIVMEGGVVEIPPAILDQLKEGGRIAAIFMEGAVGTVKLGHKTQGRVSWRPAFNADAPIIEGFEKTIAFSL